MINIFVIIIAIVILIWGIIIAMSIYVSTEKVLKTHFDNEKENEDVR